MFNESEIGINPTMCQTTQGMNRLAQSVKNLFEQLAKGMGTLLRFKLTAALVASGSAATTLKRFESGAFVSAGSGTVHDEEPGGFWEGAIGDEGWCTARDGSEGNYSIVTMALESQITNVIEQYLNGNPTKVDEGLVGVPFRNDHTTDCDIGYWMEITGITSILGIPHLTITQPTSSFKRLYFFNVSGTVAGSGGTGFGSILTSGGYFSYFGTAPVVGESVGAVPGSWSGLKGRQGVLTVGNGSGGLAAGVQEIVGHVIGVNVAAAARGATTVDVTVYGGNPGAEVSTGMTVEDCCNGGRYLEAGEAVKVQWENGHPYVEAHTVLPEAYMFARGFGISHTLTSSTTYPHELQLNETRKNNAQIFGTDTEIEVDVPGMYEVNLHLEAALTVAPSSPGNKYGHVFVEVYLNGSSVGIAADVSLLYLDGLHVVSLFYVGVRACLSACGIVRITDPTQPITLVVTGATIPASFSIALANTQLTLNKISEVH